MDEKRAFTLAEVLITLGVIGVVAAMIMPTLIQQQQKKQVAIKLKKFYSNINQAIMQYQAEEGIQPKDTTFDLNVNTEINYKNIIAKHIKSISEEFVSDDDGKETYKVALSDGSGFIFWYENATHGYFTYCTDYKYCKTRDNYDGIHSFLFTFNKGKVEPFMYASYDRNKVLDLCRYGNHDNIEVSSQNKRHFCARLIQLDGWEISKDYPWKQIMLENK